MVSRPTSLGSLLSPSRLGLNQSIESRVMALLKQSFGDSEFLVSCAQDSPSGTTHILIAPTHYCLDGKWVALSTYDKVIMESFVLPSKNFSTSPETQQSDLLELITQRLRSRRDEFIASITPTETPPAVSSASSPGIQPPRSGCPERITSTGPWVEDLGYPGWLRSRRGS